MNVLLNDIIWLGFCRPVERSARKTVQLMKRALQIRENALGQKSCSGNTQKRPSFAAAWPGFVTVL